MQKKSGNKFVFHALRLLPRSSSRRNTVLQRLPATGGASRLHADSIPPVAGRERRELRGVKRAKK